MREQKGYVFHKGKSWFVRYCDDVMQPDGTIKRKHSLQRLSNQMTAVHPPSLAITSISTTSSVPSKMARRCASTTKVAWRSSNWMKIERPRIDPEFEEVTEGEEETVKRNLMGKWSRMEAMVGTPKRIGLIAPDIVDHFAKRLEAMGQG